MTLKKEELLRNPELVTDYLRQNGHYELEQRQDIKLALRVDESVGPAMFRPDPLIPGGYVANSLTLRAVRQDIFVAGTDPDELAMELPCHSCRQKVDRQFWKLCPYCAAEFVSA